MSFQVSKYGETFETENLEVFFGNHLSKELIDKKNIQFGHQVHKCDLINLNTQDHHSSNLIQDSDGLWTSEQNVKLGIYTADCAPCFIYSSDKLYSLHLGWRSLHLGLLDKALQNIDVNEKTQIFIGPHIQFQSFEVGKEVWDSFKLTPLLAEKSDWFKQGKDSKFNISIAKIIEIKASGFNTEIFSSKIDTFINGSHHSYRRENGTKERNISFAFLK